MKKLFAPVVLALLTTAAMLTSCSKKSNNELYSCDKNLNAWAVKNKARFAGTTRAQLGAMMSQDTAGVIYAALPPEGKYQIWADKFTYARDNMGMNAAEKAHIQKALDYFKPEYWTDNNALDAFRPWADQWGQDALTKLGWDSAKLFIVAETWLTPEEMNTYSQHYINDPNPQYVMNGGGGAVNPDCGCRTSFSCQWLVEKCGDGDNCTTQYKCGLFGSSRCTGHCIPAAQLNAAYPADPTVAPVHIDSVRIH